MLNSARHVHLEQLTLNVHSTTNPRTIKAIISGTTGLKTELLHTLFILLKRVSLKRRF